MIKYRIVPDNYNGFEVQRKSTWWPFWVQLGGSNTHSSLEKAKEYLNNWTDVKIYTFPATSVN